MFLNKNIWNIAIIIILSLLSIDAKSQEILFPKTNLTIKEMFKEIENQTDYLISYPAKSMDLNKSITLSSTRLSWEKALEEVLQSSDYTSDIRGHHILIVPVKKKPIEIVTTPASNGNITVLQNNTNEQEEQSEKDLLIDIEKMEKELIARKQLYTEKEPSDPFLDVSSYQIIKEPTTSLAEKYKLPIVAIRTNLLYDFVTFTPNIGVETGLKPHSTLLLTGSYNGWRLKNHDNKNRKLWHWTTGAEYRYWFCERFNGHFFGAHAFYSEYNISGKKIPLVFEKSSENYRYQGYGLGGGVSYGYHFMFAKRWNLELNAGIGVGFLKYDKWEHEKCGNRLEQNVSRTFVAPTKLGITIAYIIK